MLSSTNKGSSSGIRRRSRRSSQGIIMRRDISAFPAVDVEAWTPLGTRRVSTTQTSMPARSFLLSFRASAPHGRRHSARVIAWAATPFHSEQPVLLLHYMLLVIHNASRERERERQRGGSAILRVERERDGCTEHKATGNRTTSLWRSQQLHCTVPGERTEPSIRTTCMYATLRYKGGVTEEEGATFSYPTMEAYDAMNKSSFTVHDGSSSSLSARRNRINQRMRQQHKQQSRVIACPSA
jgi:hypothetical protein